MRLDYSGHLIRHLLSASEEFPILWFLQFWEQVKVWWAHVRTVRWVGKHWPSILFQNFWYCTWGMRPRVILQNEDTSYEHGRSFLANLWTQNILQKLSVVCRCYSGPRRHSVAITRLSPQTSCKALWISVGFFPSQSFNFNVRMIAGHCARYDPVSFFFHFKDLFCRTGTT